jgi:glycosyltransferase involved in cell wall biosynthesis
MRIVHMDSSDARGGGARASFRVHVGLRRRGHESKVFVVYRLTHDPDVVAFVPEALGPVGRVRRRLRKLRVRADFARYRRTRPPRMWRFSDARTEHRDAVGRQLLRLLPADVLNLHSVVGMIDYEHFFPLLPPDLPVVWRMPEMAPFTGGCHYDEGCGRFVGRCGACPQLGSSDPNDLSRQTWQRKERALRCMAGRVHLVAPSRWIGEQAGRSSLFGQFPVTVIPNAMDTDEWTPVDRPAARSALALPPGARVVLFAAADTLNRIKGFAYAAEAVAALADVPDVTLLSVGHNDPPVPASVRHVHLGPINGDRLLRLVYAASDVCAVPSLAESFGQTVTEAMACGTPIVGFDTGGLRDTVREGATGYLVPPADAPAMAAALRRVLTDPDLRARLGAESRRIAVAEYGLALQAERYERLYEAVVEESRRRGCRGAINGGDAANAGSEP